MVLIVIDFDKTYGSTNFTDRALAAVRVAIARASELGHSYIGTEHLLLGILSDWESAASGILLRFGVSYNGVYNRIIAAVGQGEPTCLTSQMFTPAVKRCLRSAKKTASEFSAARIGTEHLLYAIMNQQNSTAKGILCDMNLSISKLCAGCAEAVEKSRVAEDHECAGRQNLVSLEKYGFDMVKKAASKGYDPCVGRENELERVSEILLRRSKNNPCLIGEAGVGKTAIVEALAQKIAEGRLMKGLSGIRLYSLSLTRLLAGAKYRGDFEERLKACIDEASSDKDIVLFIDEIHMLMGAGAADGAIDAANILKPMLARGEIRVIGATTFEEYRKTIEKDKALERRFSTVRIDEPSPERAVVMLKETKRNLEAHHGVSISDEAVEAAVRLSVRLLPERHLPDKAIDVLDEACSRVKLRAYQEASSRPALSASFEGYISGKISRESYFSILSKETYKETMTPPVTGDDILEAVRLQSALPIEEKRDIPEIERQLKECVMGQDEAVDAVISALKRSFAGLKDPERPLVSLMFTGPTGVGKTSLARATAKAVLGSEDELIRFDMSEFSEKHSVSRLIGSPPGYIGFDEGGELTERVRKKPYSVVLFDELEKAHREVRAILLQLLDSGSLTDSTGRKVSFKNCIVIMTTNVSQSQNSSCGFGIGNQVSSGRDTLAKTFTPELINRIDGICPFRSLSEDVCLKIAGSCLEKLKERALSAGTRLVFDSGMAGYIVKRSDTANSGAREIQRVIMREIELPIADAMISGAGELECTVRDSGVAVRSRISAV